MQKVGQIKENYTTRKARQIEFHTLFPYDDPTPNKTWINIFEGKQ